MTTDATGVVRDATPDELFASSLVYAVKAARAMARKMRPGPGDARAQAADDLKSPALVGLWEAARLYDPATGTPWEKFAVTRCAQRILDYVRLTDGRFATCSHRLRRTMTVSMTRSHVTHGRFATFDPRGETWHADPIAPPQQPEDGTPEGFAYWSLILAEDRELVRLYYFGRLTMREIGERLGLSESRVSQRIGNAIAFARERAAADPTLN